MNALSWPVVVEVDPDTPADDAVRWAAREAARRGLDLHIVLPDDHTHVPDCRDAFARALAAARAAAPEVAVSARPTTEPRLHAEQISSAEAALLVVAGPAPHVDELIMTAYCPVVVVPGGDRAPVDDAPVVLAVGPATGPEVLAFAFEEASARGAGLLATRTWSDPLVDLGRLLPGRIARWDAADVQVRHGLTDQLSACMLAYPDVAVETMVVNDRCAELLAALGHRARLLVLGRPARGAVLGALATSPAVALARHVPCPVVIVPPPGPVRHSVLPTRPVARADLRP